ncbi:hypothetical protein ACIBL3_29720 [Kribbella sp. NPDC050124]|uniref:hypothetical protein n=1 Tax=Kribbella sp. NPDC050124 TaxID=3364114 RepID=UPI00379CE7DF
MGFVGAAVAVVVVGAQLQDDSGRQGGQPPSSLPGTVASASGTLGTTSTLEATDSAAACVAQIAAAEQVVKAARIAAGHWREHVQARTDLMTGKNTEATTKAIWKRTRLAGPADVSQLATATSAYAKVVRGCEGLTSPDAAACRERLTALEVAAASGRAASGDWAAHLAMMRAHAAGDFGAEHAQEMWVSAWENAAKNLNAFARSDAALANAPACRSE